jgi:alkaline phosphatase
MIESRRRKPALALACLLASGAGVAADVSAARNVVLMVVDGGGHNAWRATAMYEGTLGQEFHDEPGWVKLAVSTHALRGNPAPPVSSEHGLTQVPMLVYDPAKAWDPTPDAGGDGAFPYYFAGYRWLRQTAPDSANTISAIVTGQRTYEGSINFDGSLQPVEDTVARLAHERGMRVGIVTTVPFTHATPAAAAGAHGLIRGTFCELAVEMLTGPYPDLIAGCGNPDFDNNGERMEGGQSKDYRYMGGKAIWDMLKGAGLLEKGRRVCLQAAGGGELGIALTGEQIAALGRWTLRQSKSEIEALTRGPTPAKLLVVPEVGEAAFWSGIPPDPTGRHSVWVGGTLQQQRGSRADPRYTPPGYDPPLGGVPSLETLTRVALNALDDDEDGFFLHVEGGAVDWAMHENQAGRMVEEMLDFKRSVEAVVAWIEAHGGWARTLLIVTADHDHLLWGPDADTVPFDALRDNGRGRLPAYRWLSRSHSNALVPLYARGVGADSLESMAVAEDPYYGRYVGQTDIFRIIKAVLPPKR